MSKELTPQPRVDVKKALELKRFKHLSFAKIGKLQGVSPQAVQQALKKFDKVLLPAEELETYRDNKGDILESVEFELLNEIVDTDRVKKASLNNVAYALGTLGNMTRLEQGKSTTNISFKDMSDNYDEIKRERQQLEESLNDA